MKFEIRVYSEDGKSKGSTILDPSIDVIDGCPVSSIGKAYAYSARFLVSSRSDYFFVSPIDSD